MVAGTAGNNLYRLGFSKGFGGTVTKYAVVDFTGRGFGKGRGKSVGLLVDFLEHVVFEIAEVGIFHIAGDTLHLPLHRLSLAVVDRQTRR